MSYTYCTHMLKLIMTLKANENKNVILQRHFVIRMFCQFALKVSHSALSYCDIYMHNSTPNDYVKYRIHNIRNMINNR